MYLGAVEGGGTKYLCVLARSSDPASIVASARIDTTTPEETLRQVVEFFRGHAIDGLGVANFGPVELDPTQPMFGCVLDTPKAGWIGAPVLATLLDGLDLRADRARWELDVNAAAIGEFRRGSGQGVSPYIYITVGTGIGGGVLIDGAPVRGLLHPEIGHLPLPAVALPDGSVDTFRSGVCPFHDTCWESRATGPALAARAGRPGADLADDDPALDVEARYLALGVAAVTFALSPRRITLGGGVVESRAEWLLPRVRAYLVEALGGYIRREVILDGAERYLVAPRWIDPSPGIVGALALAGDTRV